MNVKQASKSKPTNLSPKHPSLFLGTELATSPYLQRWCSVKLTSKSLKHSPNCSHSPNYKLFSLLSILILSLLDVFASKTSAVYQVNIIVIHQRNALIHVCTPHFVYTYNKSRHSHQALTEKDNRFSNTALHVHTIPFLRDDSSASMTVYSWICHIVQ